MTGESFARSSVMATDNLWIVVIHQAGARIFRRNRPADGIELVEKFDHPTGRLRDHDIDTDKPGRQFTPTPATTSRGPQGAGHTYRRHGFTPRVMPHETDVIRFTQQIAHHLETSRSQNKYGGLVLVADPHELGLLKESLDKKTGEKVIATLNKNLAKVRDIEIENQIYDVLMDADQKMILQRSA
jgi:protein required for attachment to host cells